jgi:hypothetical protein
MQIKRRARRISKRIAVAIRKKFNAAMRLRPRGCAPKRGFADGSLIAPLEPHGNAALALIAQLEHLRRDQQLAQCGVAVVAAVE